MAEKAMLKRRKKYLEREKEKYGRKELEKKKKENANDINVVFQSFNGKVYHNHATRRHSLC